MIEYENSKSDDQLEELLLLTEQMQEELDQKDRTIEELKVQLDESLTLNERLNSENRVGNIQALKNDLRKTKELLHIPSRIAFTSSEVSEIFKARSKSSRIGRMAEIVFSPLSRRPCSINSQSVYVISKKLSGFTY